MAPIETAGTRQGGAKPIPCCADCANRYGTTCGARSYAVMRHGRDEDLCGGEDFIPRDDRRAAIAKARGQ